MAKDFIGVGWKYPVRSDATGKITMSKYEEDIKESIFIILGTSKGERVMRPDFGCGIHDLVFASISTTTIGMVESTVQEALIKYEPRINLINVSVVDDEANVGKLKINIDYRVRTTNNEFNLVYPFYLTETGEIGL
jgi:phage baseplate assembly protein W